MRALVHDGEGLRYRDDYPQPQPPASEALKVLLRMTQGI